MTREEYLENHDAHEGAEEEIRDPRCPICGSDEHTVIYKQDGEPIGCDACLDVRIRCPHCGSEAWDKLIWRGGTPIGCDRCVREIERWEWVP